MIINNNLSAVNAYRTLGARDVSLSRNIEKLSSGLRINRGADDASGLAVSEKMRAQIRGLNQAERNIQDGVSFIQTAEGYLAETSDVLQRIRELSIQSANGIYSDEDRMQIQVEIDQLVDEIDRVASHAQFNGMNIFTGRFALNSVSGDVFQLHVGHNMDQSETMYIGTMTTTALNLRTMDGMGIDMTTVENANRAIGVADKALQLVSKQRADLGAYQNRMEMAAQGVAIAAENTTAAESRIRDVDMAREMVDYTKNMILTQANTAMLAQANMKTQNVLQLL